MDRNQLVSYENQGKFDITYLLDKCSSSKGTDEPKLDWIQDSDFTFYISNKSPPSK